MHSNHKKYALAVLFERKQSKVRKYIFHLAIVTCCYFLCFVTVYEKMTHEIYSINYDKEVDLGNSSMLLLIDLL